MTDPGFHPEVGAPTPKGSVKKLLFGRFFSEKLHEIERIRTLGMRPWRPLDPSM